LEEKKGKIREAEKGTGNDASSARTSDERGGYFKNYFKLKSADQEENRKDVKRTTKKRKTQSSPKEGLKRETGQTHPITPFTSFRESKSNHGSRKRDSFISEVKGYMGTSGRSNARQGKKEG